MVTVKTWRWVAAPVVMAMLAVAAYLVSPLFIRPTLVEESPLVGVATRVPTPPPAPTAVPTVMAPMVAGPAVTEEPMADEPMGEQPMAAEPAGMAETPMAAESTGPRILAEGQFDRKDAIHAGSGTAILARTADGKSIVRFEGFSVTNGPDLFVYLSAHPKPSSSSELHTGGLEVNLGRLKAPQGAFSYEIPAEVDLANVKSVAVYCKAFSTMFSSAELAWT